MIKEKPIMLDLNLHKRIKVLAARKGISMRELLRQTFKEE